MGHNMRRGVETFMREYRENISKIYVVLFLLLVRHRTLLMTFDYDGMRKSMWYESNEQVLVSVNKIKIYT